MRKKSLILFFLILTAAVGAFGADLDSLLGKSLNTLYQDTAKPLVICFGNLTYADKGLGSAFSRYLEDHLALAIKKCPQFELFAKDKLESILETQQLCLSDLFSGQDTIRAGKLKNIRAILSGRFFDTGLNIELFLDLTGTETGTIIGSADAVIPKSIIPANISLLPDNYNDALAVLNELSDIQNGGDENLVVKAWIKRGDGGTYVKGEELRIHFYANRDCYIKIYHIDVNGNMQLIFPNQYHKGNMLKKNTVYTIPDESYGFTFTLGAPFGTEFIKIMASTKQFDEVEDPFKDLGKVSEKPVEKGLSILPREDKITEQVLSYTIIAK
jgi:hypothetical protein